MGFTRYGLAKGGKITSVLAELTRGLRHVVEEKCGQNWLLIMALLDVQSGTSYLIFLALVLTFVSQG